jgi:hypothetical protein
MAHVLSCLQLTFTKPHILLLDEPSNHLDIDAVDALIQGLAMFKGGVLMVRGVCILTCSILQALTDVCTMCCQQCVASIWFFNQINRQLTPAWRFMHGQMAPAARLHPSSNVTTPYLK